MTEKKYEFTDETMTTADGHVLHRIRAIRPFYTLYSSICRGQLGGWVESEDNLSHGRTAWVSDNAEVYGNAWVGGDAQIVDSAKVCENARIEACALVGEHARVAGNAVVAGHAKIRDTAEIIGNAWIRGEVRVNGSSLVYGKAVIKGNAHVDNAFICQNNQYLTIGPIGSRLATTTFFASREGGIKVTCGCFLGTIDEFEEAVAKTHGDNEHARVYRCAIALAKEQIYVQAAMIENKKE